MILSLLLISFRTFGDKDMRQEMVEAFEVADEDKDGKISSKDLEKVMRRLHMSVNEDDIEEMIKLADKTGEGKVSLDDFLSIMNCL